MINVSQIKPHTPVVCSKNVQFAVIDQIEGTDTIKLPRDKKGQHIQRVVFSAVALSIAASGCFWRGGGEPRHDERYEARPAEHHEERREERPTEHRQEHRE
jgi:hypothetical protein